MNLHSIIVCRILSCYFFKHSKMECLSISVSQNNKKIPLMCLQKKISLQIFIKYCF